MPYFDSEDDLPLFVRDVGYGPAVVLIHGWPLNADMWEHQTQALAEAGHRVLAYDRRGFGRSAQPWSGYDYDTLASDLKCLIDQSGVRDAVIVGFSMGGGEVARYVGRYGQHRLRGAVLVSAVTPYMMKAEDNPEGVEPSVFEGIEKGLREDRPRFLKEFARSFYGVDKNPGAVSDAWLDWSQSLAMQGSLHATLKCGDSFAGTDFREDVKAMSSLDTLLIHGTADETVPIGVSADRVAAMLPSAKYLKYEGAPHGLFATHADRLTRDLEAFLKETR
jgi:pimeloyl-ACP methyl ester carboxylesterase